MNTKVEKVEGNVVNLEINVPNEKFRDALKKSYVKNVGKFNIPGFRKGKAPMAMIEKQYGEGVFYEDAIELVCDETYPVAVKENELLPVDYPKIDVVQIGKDVDFIYTAKVTVKPEVKLGQYREVEVNKVEYPVTDEDVNGELNSMREKNGRIINVEDGVIENGNIAVIDFEGFVDEVPFEGGKGENYELTIGSGTFIPGFEEQLIGTKVGESKDVNVNFPEDYSAEDLKGKSAIFKVTVKEIKTKELPELDDELAKDVSEFDTLDELKADIKSKQEANNSQKAKRDFENQVVTKVVDASEIEIPEVMVDREVEYMVKDLDYRLKYQGMDIQKYTEMMGITVDAIKNDFRDMAKTRVKTNLVLEAISKAENITVPDEDIEKRAEELSVMYGTKDAQKMKESILNNQGEIIKEELANNMVIDLLVNSSKEVE
jgi:trigger factor